MDNKDRELMEHRVSEAVRRSLEQVMAVDGNPGLIIRRNGRVSCVMNSALNHPPYDHHTSRRRYFRYPGGGNYFLEPGLLP